MGVSPDPKFPDFMFKYYTLDENKVPQESALPGVPHRVGRDIIGDVTVSTVFLGIPHGWVGDQPILFETMIFNSEDSELKDYQERYVTYEEAEEGHKLAVQRVKEGFRFYERAMSWVKSMFVGIVEKL